MRDIWVNFVIRTFLAQSHHFHHKLGRERNIRGKYSAILWLGNFWPGIRVKLKQVENWWRRIIDIAQSHHIDHHDDNDDNDEVDENDDNDDNDDGDGDDDDDAKG